MKQRENKFRAWDIKNNKWINISTVYMLLHATDRVFDKNTGKPIKCVLTQFTGLKDKNGIDIYEGDMVASEYDNYAIVFSIGEFKMRSETRQLPMINYNKVEIIGNIYKNPELIK